MIGPLARRVVEIGWKSPFPVQTRVVPLALRGNNVVASAETGTGKTAAFALPLLQQIHIYRAADKNAANQQQKTKSSKPASTLYAVVLAPTSELADQIEHHFAMLGNGLEPPVRTAVVVGGVSRQKQVEALRAASPEVLIGTPGRILEIAKEHAWFASMLKGVRHLVLDECDRMLSMGFLPDIKDVYGYLPKPNNPNSPKASASSKEENPDSSPASVMQVMFFSATLVPGIEDLMRRFASRHILVSLNAELQVAETVKHIQYSVTNRKKYALLVYFLKRKQSLKGKQLLIFVRTQQRAERIASHLVEDGFKAVAVHGDKTPVFCKAQVDAFKKGQTQIIVATDVLARGVDFDNQPVVVNFDLPPWPEDYVHRVGRTGRAGKEGMAISLVGRHPHLIEFGSQKVEINETHSMKEIETFLGKPVALRKVPGSWKDEAEGDEQVQGVQKESEAAAQEILHKVQEKNERVKEHKERMLQQKLQKKARKLGKSVEDLVIKTKNENDGEWEDIEEEVSNHRQSSKKQQMAPTIPKKTDSTWERLNSTKPTPSSTSTSTSTLSLRNFREGRYEDLISRFNAKSARKRGLHVPGNLDKMLQSQRKKSMSDAKSKLSQKK